MSLAVEFVTVPRDGERENGDAAVLRRTDDLVLLGVIDALGHGERAAEAAIAGVRYLDDVRLDRGLRPVIEGLHERLRGTRGAAALLLLFQGHKLEGCGVGNVGLRAYRARVPAMLTPGVLGGSITRLRLFQAEVAPGDRIILFSDGISSRFEEEGSRNTPALATAQAIMDHHRKPHDDATVLVADVEPINAGGHPRPPPPTPRAP